MKAATVLVVILSCLSMIDFSGCSRGPKETPLSQAEIQEAAKFFGGNTNFTCTQTHTIRGPAFQNVPPWIETLAFSEGKRRDKMSQYDGAPIIIFRPDRKTIYNLWPSDKVVTEIRLPEGYKMSVSQIPFLHMVREKADIGSETINGHPCVKCRVVTQEEEGIIEWTTWEATDMNRFPVRAEHPAVRQQTVRFEFSDIVLTKPDPSLFEPPKGYKKITNERDAANYIWRKLQ